MCLPVSIPLPTPLLKVQADTVVTSGGRVTAIADLSGNGNDGIEGTSGHGPIYDATAWGGVPGLRFEDNASWLKFTGASLINAITGSNKAFAVFISVRSCLHHFSASSYWFAAKSTVSTRYFGLRSTAASNYFLEHISSTASGAKPSILSLEQHHSAAHIFSFSRIAGSKILVVIDGNELGLIDSSIDALDVDTFAIGALPSVAPSVSGDFIFKELRFYPGNINQVQRFQIQKEMAVFSRLDWKQKLGATLPSDEENLGIIHIGQSNTEGRGFSLPYHTVTSDSKLLKQSGFLVPLSERSHDSTDQSMGTSMRPDPSLIGGSYVSKFADELKALLPNSSKIHLTDVATALASTSSLLWNAGISESPLIMDTLFGCAVHRALEFLKAPNSKIAFILYQGEAEGDANDGGASAALWDTNWSSTFDAFNTRLAGTFKGSVHFFVVKLPPTPFLNPTNWAAVIVRQQALIDARSDTRGLQSPDTSPAGQLHHDTSTLELLAANLAPLVKGALFP